MKIQVFAVLKDYFEKEFELTGTGINTVAELKACLTNQNQLANGLLNLCRFAVADEFVEQDYKLKEDDNICIFPPSSGG